MKINETFSGTEIATILLRESCKRIGNDLPSVRTSVKLINKTEIIEDNQELISITLEAEV